MRQDCSRHTPELARTWNDRAAFGSVPGRDKTQFCRVVRETVRFSSESDRRNFTQTAIKDCITRTASQLRPKYCELRDRLAEEKFLHSDETRWPINGVRHYLWLLHGLNLAFISINKSRSRKVITNLLGDHFRGAIVSDCLSVYRAFAAAFQKCWAHLLRKTFYLKEDHPKSDINILHRQLTDLYDEAEKYRTMNMSESERIWTGIRLTQKLQRITNNKWKSKESKSIAKNWLKEYEGQWLVGVFMPDVELTNNKDERGIRKVIPTRKLLGGHRTEKGAEDFAIIETNRQTWKLNQKSPYLELLNYLREDNSKTAA